MKRPPPAPATHRLLRRALPSLLLLGAGLTAMHHDTFAEPLEWHERPGQWFRNLLYAPRALEPAPLALGQALDGRPASLVQWNEGLVLVTFWASWCPHCRNELPQLDALLRARADPRLRVLAVNVYDSPADMKRWIEQREWQLTFTFDSDRSVARAYAISPLPTNVLVDARTQQIVKRWEGVVDPLVIAAEINRHLPKAP